MKHKLKLLVFTIIFSYGVTVSASILGFYGKIGGGFAEAKCQNEQFSCQTVVSKVALNYQAPGWGLECSYFLSGEPFLKAKLEGAYKWILPLSRRLNLYSQIQMAWDSTLKSPGFGVGLVYALNSNFLVDFAWTRHYVLQYDWLNKENRPSGATTSWIVSIGYYLG